MGDGEAIKKRAIQQDINEQAVRTDYSTLGASKLYIYIYI